MRHVASNESTAYLIEKAWSSETALNCPRELREVQGASSACNLAISGKALHQDELRNLDIHNEPAGSFDFPNL